MKIIYNTNTNAYYNLAFEQAAMELLDGDVFMLWQNASAIIVGKNQNASAEINRDYVNSHNIKVVRRLTGGGAVYHDSGNVNFTFITSAEDSGTLDFARFAEPMIKAMKAIGINAELSGRNDIVAVTGEGAFKVSGNAQCVINGRLIHHGTLLYDTDLSVLANTLNVSPEKLVSKGIKSVRSRVDNIKHLGGLDLTTMDFIAYLLNFATNEYYSEVCEPPENVISRAEELMQSRYSLDEWNYGAYKSYAYTNKARYDWGSAEVCYNVRDGKISDFKLLGDFFETGDISKIAEVLNGCEVSHSALTQALSAIDIGCLIKGAANSDIILILN